MSSIEDRLVRDIAAVSAAVAVTEAELNDAREEHDERLETRRDQLRARALTVGGAAALLIPLLGVAVLQATEDDERSAAPASPAPTMRDAVEVFLDGDAPSHELLQGVWRVDNGTLLLRFSPPDHISIDDRGRLFDDAAVQGTYELDGDLITVDVDTGSTACAGQTFALRASVAGPRILHVVHTQPGERGCSSEEDERWVLEQVLPTAGTLTEFGPPRDASWGPATWGEGLHGVWMAVGGGHALELDPRGSYYVADDTGDLVDRGVWARSGSDLSLASSARSSACSGGDRLVWSGLEHVELGGTTMMRGTVEQDDCGGAWAGARWILLPHEDG